MLRLFGVTSPIEQWLRWLGAGHTRFTDLPSGLRLEQLTLWNRPPIAETPLVCWLEVGHRARAPQPARPRRAATTGSRAPSSTPPAAGAAAEIELALARVEAESDSRRHETSPPRLALVEERLRTASLPDAEALPFRARLAIQRAVLCTRPPPGSRARPRRCSRALRRDPRVDDPVRCVLARDRARVLRVDAGRCVRRHALGHARRRRGRRWWPRSPARARAQHAERASSTASAPPRSTRAHIGSRRCSRTKSCSAASRSPRRAEIVARTAVVERALARLEHLAPPLRHHPSRARACGPRPSSSRTTARGSRAPPDSSRRAPAGRAAARIRSRARLPSVPRSACRRALPLRARPSRARRSRGSARLARARCPRRARRCRARRHPRRACAGPSRN